MIAATVSFRGILFMIEVYPGLRIWLPPGARRAYCGLHPADATAVTLATLVEILPKGAVWVLMSVMCGRSLMTRLRPYGVGAAR